MVRIMAPRRSRRGNYFGRVPSRTTKAAFCCALACGAIAASRLVAHAAAGNPTEIYIYNQSGQPVNMTGIDSYHDPQVYDAYNNLIGTVNSSDEIISPSGQDVGFIAPG